MAPSVQRYFFTIPGRDRADDDPDGSTCGMLRQHILYAECAIRELRKKSGFVAQRPGVRFLRMHWPALKLVSGATLDAWSVLIAVSKAEQLRQHGADVVIVHVEEN